MKPLWKAGSASYDWIDEEVLRGDVPEIATDNDDRLITTFFDDDLEESGSGREPSGQHREPSGLNSHQQHEAGSGDEDPAIAQMPIQHSQRSDRSSHKKRRLGEDQNATVS